MPVCMQLKLTCDTHSIHLDYTLEPLQHGRKKEKEVHLEMTNVEQTEIQD